MEPNTIMAYCLFMVACFGSQSRPPDHTGLQLKGRCPGGCSCYSAPETGIENDFDAESYICGPDSGLAQSIVTDSFGPRRINTLVMRGGALRNQYYGRQTRRIETRSLVLEAFHLLENSGPTAPKYVFELFDLSRLAHLSILGTGFVTNAPTQDQQQFDWKQAWRNEQLRSLRTLYVDGGNLPILPQSFRWICRDSSSFHTVILTDSQLVYIDREAFAGCERSLRKLVLSRNLLRTWHWLTRTPDRWSKLTYLDLSSNQLASIPADLLERTPALNILYLAHNRFKYFSLPIIQPLLSLDELLLAAAVEGQQYDYLIFADKPMAALQTDIWNRARDDPPVAPLPVMMLDSLQNSIQYDCPSQRDTSGPIGWFDVQNCARKLEYLPDSLYLNSKSKLMRGKDEQSSLDGGPPMQLISVRGIEFLENQNNNNNNNPFRFDTVQDEESYRQIRRYILDQLDSMSKNLKPNTVRIQLLSTAMLLRIIEYPASPIVPIGIDSQTLAQIQLMFDLVSEILDEAAARDQYVILSLFDRRMLVTEPLVNQISISNFETIFIAPLMTRIASHSALIGLELIDDFMHDYAPANNADEQLCDPNRILSMPIESQLLGIFATSFKKYSGDKLLGVSIAANCEACLLYAFHPRCREAIGFDDPYGLDFVSIRSSLSETDSMEPYNFRNWPTKRPDWFAALSGKPEPISTGSGARAPPPKLGLFFLLHNDLSGDETAAIREMEALISNFATGYFVMNGE